LEGAVRSYNAKTPRHQCRHILGGAQDNVEPISRTGEHAADTALQVVREWDIDVPIDLALAYFGELRGAPYRQWVEIGQATHMLLLEKNRPFAFNAIRDFYDLTLAAER
jgi:hypothetical protein